VLRSHQVKKLTPVLAEDVFGKVFRAHVLKLLAAPAPEDLRQVPLDVLANFVEVGDAPVGDIRWAVRIRMPMSDVPNDRARRIRGIVGTHIPATIWVLALVDCGRQFGIEATQFIVCQFAYEFLFVFDGVSKSILVGAELLLAKTALVNDFQMQSFGNGFTFIMADPNAKRREADSVDLAR
jgi:hypothetical protein